LPKILMGSEGMQVVPGIQLGPIARYASL